MADRRIYTRYYRRYDGKMIYVVTMANDVDTNEDTVIWMQWAYTSVPLHDLSDALEGKLGALAAGLLFKLTVEPGRID